MAGGPTTPELVAAVTAAGALGSFGFAYSTVDQIHSVCQAFRELCASRKLSTDCGWNANFFVFPAGAEPAAELVSNAINSLEPLAQRVFVDADSMKHDTRLPVLRDQVAAALTYKPSLLSFHLGIPADEVLSMVKSAGCLIALSATSLEEAHQVEASGADFIVAQGYEAGGHRGIFNPSADDHKLGVEELVNVITAKCDLPVIAAGGIMHGSDIATVLNSGADAVQMGSAFLTVEECGSSNTYRRVIESIGTRNTQITMGFSGRPARGISNLFIDTMEGSHVLPFPWQGSLTGSLRKAAGQSNDFELMSLWAGTGFQKARNCTAAELIDALQQETEQALTRLS